MTDTLAFSIADELKKLAPLNLESEPSPTEEASEALQRWDELTRSLVRLGKQQMKTNQVTEMLTHEVGEAVSTLRESAEVVRQQFIDHHAQLQAVRAEAQEVRLRVVEFIDLLDDLSTVGKQRADQEWLTRIERLTSRALEVLARIGLTEIPALGRSFNEEEHEALGAIEATSGQQPYQVVEVIRRGFRFGGAVLRRSQVLTTR